MRPHSLRLIVALLTAGIIAFTQVGCSENTLIDADVAPNLNNIEVKSLDTFSIITNTVYDDSVITSFNITGLPIYQAIGTIGGSGAGDPYFGKTNAGLYMQIIPESTSPTIFNNTIDSAILILPYSGVSYGDFGSTAPKQTFSVYPITGNISKDSTYYAFNQTSINTSKLWGSAVVNVNKDSLADSVFMYGRYRKGGFAHIKLNSQFISDLKDATQNYAGDYPTFLQNFKGLYIAADSTQPGNTLSYFRLDGTDTFSQANVLVFYHTTSDTAKVFQYPFSGSYCGHYNTISRNYTGTPARQHIKAGPFTTSDSVILVQNQPGAALDVRIPFVKNLKTLLPKMVINKAELVITQINENTSSTYTPVTKLYARGIDINGLKYEIADRYPLGSLSPLAFLGGYAQSATIGSFNATQYIINIPREIINTINEQRELHLHINGTQDYPGAYRLLAGGSTYSDPNYRIKLRIVYSIQK